MVPKSVTIGLRYPALHQAIPQLSGIVSAWSKSQWPKSKTKLLYTCPNAKQRQIVTVTIANDPGPWERNLSLMHSIPERSTHPSLTWRRPTAVPTLWVW